MYIYIIYKLPSLYYIQISACIMYSFEMFFVQILACLKCRVEYVLCADFSMRARRSARLARLARLHPCMYFPKFVCWPSLLFFLLLNKWETAIYIYIYIYTFTLTGLDLLSRHLVFSLWFCIMRYVKWSVAKCIDRHILRHMMESRKSC